MILTFIKFESSKVPDTKIFIDTDEEITFIVEKIKQAATRNVVVIVPDRASIFITSASLKLLKKSIDKLDKKVILVTMDEAGKKMADGMEIATASRVREITSETWNNVVKYKPVLTNKSYSQKLKENPQNRVASDFTEKELQEVKVVPEEISESDAVIPNIQKFEYKNNQEEKEEIVSPNLEGNTSPTEENVVNFTDKDLENLTNNVDLGEAVEDNFNEEIENTVENVEPIMEEEPQLDIPKSVLHEEVEEGELEKLDNMEDNMVEYHVLPEEEEFKMPHFTASEDIAEEIPAQIEQYEEPSKLPSEGFVFFEGKDIADMGYAKEEVKKKFQIREV